MKIVIIGASGTVGRAVTEELSRRHEVIRVGRTQGDEQVDITSQASVQALFEKIGPVDAIVSASGGLYFGPLATMKDSDFNQGLQDKLLGQVRLALTGQHYLNEGGSITLISGIVAHEPIAQGVNATTVNAALEGFVRAAACELPRGIRINLISPTVLTESVERTTASSRALKACPPRPWRRPIAAAWKACRAGGCIRWVTEPYGRRSAPASGAPPLRPARARRQSAPALAPIR
jgi:NAD(P)-dependent dehydrogenase (short-subunit alcohol dehydrogenase family)